MPFSNFTRRHWVKLALVAVLPLGLYFILAERMSWQPRTLKIGDGTIVSLSFAADSKTLVVGLRGIPYPSGNTNDELQVWEIQSKTLLRSLPLAPAQVLGETRLAPDGKTVAGIYAPDNGPCDHDCALWDGSILQWLHALNSTFVFTDNGRYLKICCDHHPIIVPKGRGIAPGVSLEPSIITLNTSTAKMLSRIRLVLPRGYSYRSGFLPQDEAASRLWTLSPDGRRGAVVLTAHIPDRDEPGEADFTNKVMLFDTRTGKGQRILSAASNHSKNFVSSIAFSATGKSVVTLTDGLKGQGEIQLWDTQTGQARQVLQDYPLAFSPNDKLWVSAPDDNTLQLFNAQTGSVLRTIKTHHAPAMDYSSPGLATAFSPNGTTLAVGGEDGTVKLWRIK